MENQRQDRAVSNARMLAMDAMDLCRDINEFADEYILSGSPVDKMLREVWTLIDRAATIMYGVQAAVGGKEVDLLPEKPKVDSGEDCEDCPSKDVCNLPQNPFFKGGPNPPGGEAPVYTDGPAPTSPVLTPLGHKLTDAAAIKKLSDFLNAIERRGR